VIFGVLCTKQIANTTDCLTAFFITSTALCLTAHSTVPLPVLSAVLCSLLCCAVCFQVCDDVHTGPAEWRAVGLVGPRAE
jgi:hypothetical protein